MLSFDDDNDEASERFEVNEEKQSYDSQNYGSNNRGRKPKIDFEDDDEEQNFEGPSIME